ncbi:MAG: hypothetical protein JNN25_14680 [Candidatus Kapabacteria bacterium]|nr:hypothetical protein [Candidatus Kapabacteria bacterium]
MHHVLAGQADTVLFLLRLGFHNLPLQQQLFGSLLFFTDRNRNFSFDGECASHNVFLRCNFLSILKADLFRA